LVSGFAGLLFVVDSPRVKAAGDLVVTGTYTIENIEQLVDGNVYVQTGGNLIIRNATLSIISNGNVAERHSVNVNSGGTLTMDHGTITTYLDQIDPWPFLTLNVNGGTLLASGASVFKFPGSIVLTAGASVTLDDSTVTALSASLVSEFVVGAGGSLVADDADDSAAISVTDSTIRLYDSTIEYMPEYPTSSRVAANMSLSGSSTMLAINSYIGVDFGPLVSPTDWYLHNVLTLSGLSHAYLYGCWFEKYTGTNADRAPAISTAATAATAFAASKGAADNTGEAVAALSLVDATTYQVNVGETMEIDTWSSAYADSEPVSSASISVTYWTAGGYNGNGAIQWAAQGDPYQSTGIIPTTVAPPGTTVSFSLPMGSVSTVGDVKNLNVRFVPGGTLGSVEIDRMTVVFQVGSGAFIYRWLNATVGDAYGVPIGPPNYDATVSAKFTGSTELQGQDAFYYTSAGVSTTPPAEVLNYLGKTAGDYADTMADGRAVIPYLTDILMAAMASPLYVGSYDLTGSSTILGTPYSSTSAFSMDAYPAMDAGDRSSDFTVKLEGVSVQSPDPARWLVVPPSLVIEGMTYYHAGDVIVAASGTLSFVDSTFQLVQEFANQRTITVDGTQALPARLEFHDTLVTSEMSINIVVKGYGVVEAWDTEFQGVNIIALEQSQVIFHNVTMSGNITTAWDSQAEINVYDSALMQTITLSGYAVGGFTNTSVPSVKVEDDAVANIYRWIHVTVYDGAGFPCPNALVAARYFINGTVAASGIADGAGVARVRSTGTVITATGSSFWGNYKVNASLSIHSHVYYADEEISVGVMPYTEPLGKNATYAIMSIPDALPDLTSVVVTADPNNPRNHEDTLLNATVYNTGAVAAHNVTANFYDETDTKEFIGTGIVDTVPVDGSAVISILWVAHSPLSPITHNISVIVDPENTVPELDETPITGYTVIQVQNLPDVRVTSDVTELFPEPSEVVVNTQVILRGYVHNDGDATTGDVQVDFYDEPDGGSKTLIASTVVSGIAWNHYSIASVFWTPDVAGTHKVYVFVNGGGNGTHLFNELSYFNNEAERTVTVLTPANLVVSNLQFDPTGSVPGGDQLVITATIRNTQLAPVYLVNVALYIGSVSNPSVSDYDITDRLADNGATTIVFSYTAPIVTTSTDLTFFIVANPTQSEPEEITYDDNTASGTITVLDMRPDMVVNPSGITVYFGASEVTNSMYGRTVGIEVNITNTGGRAANNFNVSIGVRNLSFDLGGSYNHTYLDEEYDISAEALNHTLTIVYRWSIALTVWAEYEIWVFVDSWGGVGNVSEPNEVNNWATTPFTITPLDAEVQIIVDPTEYIAGDDVYVTATITYTGTGIGVPNVTLVIFQLTDSTDINDVVPDSQTVAVDSTNVGGVVQTLTIPTTIESGSYKIVAVFFGETYDSSSPATLQISAKVSGGLFPWWVWILIIVVVGAAIAGFTAYTYFYGLGKYVECGECGAFIPAASKRCPKCGVEFEAGTMKCSECGAWIPAESTECPNCGVKFVGEAEEEEDYLERMKKEYDEVVSKYRELAKPELGKKFSDKAFDEWWRKQPGYISFDDWLAKEEEKKKEGPVPCPVCGTLNPKEATVCHKCGTVFGAPKEGPPKKGPPLAGETPAAAPAEAEHGAEAPPTTQAAPAAGVAPRMVIRRPIEKKVVPKKIIRTPTGQVVEEEPKEDDNQ
jgi:ribosomal protein L40E